MNIDGITNNTPYDMEATMDQIYNVQWISSNK